MEPKGNCGNCGGEIESGDFCSNGCLNTWKERGVWKILKEVFSGF